MASNLKETAVKTVIVERSRLQSTLTTNLETHKKEFAEATEGFRSQQADKLRELSQAVMDATQAGTTESRKVVHNVYAKFRDLDRPFDHSDSYVQAIALMEWETRDKVELSINDFEAYVQDNWNWSASFKNSHSNYSPSH